MILNLTSFTEKNTPAVSPDVLSPLDLAFVGDGVYELLVRQELLTDGSRRVKDLHRMAVEQVKAGAQAKAAACILPVLTAEESDIFRRGRNAKVGGIPKNASSGEYHAATGLEALFGWLYLKGETQRIEELFRRIRSSDENQKADEKTGDQCREG